MLLGHSFGIWPTGLFDHVIPKIFEVACGVGTSRGLWNRWRLEKVKVVLVYVDLVTDTRSDE